MWKMILFEMVGMLAVLYIAAGSVSGFLYIPILVILLSVFVVVGGKHGLKGVGVSILVFIVSLVMFNAYYNFTCGPNYFDVRVMKPMAEKISTYIVKHGIPKSLKDIPDLPYGLEGCERSEEYLNSDNNGGMKQVAKEKAILYNLSEECHFKNIKLSYWLQKGLKENDVSITIKMVSTNRTVVEYGLGAEKGKNLSLSMKDIGSYKSSGICNPMRQ